MSPVCVLLCTLVIRVHFPPGKCAGTVGPRSSPGTCGAESENAESSCSEGKPPPHTLPPSVQETQGENDDAISKPVSRLLVTWLCEPDLSKPRREPSGGSGLARGQWKGNPSLLTCVLCHKLQPGIEATLHRPSLLCPYVV